MLVREIVRQTAATAVWVVEAHTALLVIDCRLVELHPWETQDNGVVLGDVVNQEGYRFLVKANAELGSHPFRDDAFDYTVSQNKLFGTK